MTVSNVPGNFKLALTLTLQWHYPAGEIGWDFKALSGEVDPSSLLLSSLELSDTNVYAPYIRALLGTASHFCEVVVLKLRTGRWTASGWRT